jgi:3-hydroxyisobutyrate dehydrogenase-like beta-hydroxyacid dehydrogenase
MMDKIKEIGFIGLGSMGEPMAKNLLKAGFGVTVYNRNKDKAQACIALGAKPAKHPCDVLKTAEVVNGPHGISSSLRPGVIHLSMSTIAPATSKKLDAEHKEKGAVYLAATVSGRPAGAIAGTLWIFLAGENKAKEKVKPVLDALGKRTFDLGEESPNANVFKLAGNFLILSSIQALAEAFAFVEKNGLSPKQAGEIFTESLFSCQIYHTYAPLLAEQRFEPAGFALHLGFKDFRLLRAAAAESFIPMPLASLLHEQLLACMAHGCENMDWSVIGKLCRQNANL